MIKYNFVNTLQKIIDKLDENTLKNMLLELAEENQDLKNIFNSMKEAVIVLDDKSRVLFNNKMAINIFEITTKNPNGLKINEIIHNDIIINNINKAIKDEGINDLEIFLEYEDPKYISLSLNPLVKNGKIIGNIIICEDITREIKDKNRLRQAESLAALTTISAGIAHEIKNPLGAIGIHIQLLEQELKRAPEIFDDEIKLSVDVIKNEIDRLNNIVVDYLMTVRPLKAELLPAKLDVFLNDFIDFIKPELISNEIKIIKDLKKLPKVYLDEKYFKQALLNLIKNSIESIKKDGIIKIEAFQEKNYVIINVIDNGIGVPEDIQSKIFDPYFTNKNTGTGLGLTIVYKIIKEHNGEINFNSKKGNTVFTIKLPLTYIDKGLIEYSGEKVEY